MVDSENAASKKRVAGIQISKDNPELDDDSPDLEMGTFKRASDEVLATRRIVKVRRSQPEAATSNPFAALQMVPPTNLVANSTNPSAHTDTSGDKKEANAGTAEIHGENGKGEETDTATSVERLNGLEDMNNKVEEKTERASVKDDNNVEVNAVEEPVETDRDIENGESNAKTKGETTKEDSKDTEKIASGEETDEKPSGEETDKKPSGEETESKSAREENAEKEKLESENKDTDAAKPMSSFSSFQQLSSSQNAFTGFAGTGFGASSFSFGSAATEGSPFGGSSESILGFRKESPMFTFGGSSNRESSSSQPSHTSAPLITSSVVPSMQEVSVETGEENEKAVFTADAVLFEFSDGGWKERGKGELKLNASLSDAEKARLVMRARGNYRLILNASLYPDMTLTNMESKGITFACINCAGEGKSALSTFALKFRDVSFVEEFREAVGAHKGKKTTELKTPENSPKPADD